MIDRVLSSDSHVLEPPDLWTSRIAPRFADRAPKVVSEESADWWYADGYKIFSFPGGADTGVRFDKPEELRREARFTDVRKGAYDPDAKIEDMETDGVQGEVVYPTMGLLFYRLPDSAYVSEVARCYNDWLSDFCSAHPDRIKGIGMINVDDVDEAVNELSRVARLGLAGAMIPVMPAEGLSYDLPRYEALWAAADDLDLPISLHVGTNRAAPSGHVVEGDKSATSIDFAPRPSLRSLLAHWVQVALADMLFAGVFERHPKLKVVSAEHELSWAPHFLEAIDYTYTQRPMRPTWHRFASDAVPSDFFRSNVFLSFQEDALGIELRHVIGVDRLMWGSDYPHQESTWPRSRQIIERILDGVPDEERSRIVNGTVDHVYGFGRGAPAE